MGYEKTIQYIEEERLCGCRRGNCPSCNGKGCRDCRNTGMCDKCKGRGVIKVRVPGVVRERTWWP